MATKKRRLVKVVVTLSVAPYITAPEARRELRSRVNQGCCWFYDEEDVKVREAKPIGRARRKSTQGQHGVAPSAP